MVKSPVDLENITFYSEFPNLKKSYKKKKRKGNSFIPIRKLILKIKYCPNREFSFLKSRRLFFFVSLTNQNQTIVFFLQLKNNNDNRYSCKRPLSLLKVLIILRSKEPRFILTWCQSYVERLMMKQITSKIQLKRTKKIKTRFL